LRSHCPVLAAQAMHETCQIASPPLADGLPAF